jgi:hypothetical protein
MPVDASEPAVERIDEPKTVLGKRCAASGSRATPELA